MIDLYAMASPNVTKVTIMLEEVGEAYDLHFINVFREEQFTEVYKKLSPASKVPAVVDRDAPGGPLSVFESGAILLYLAEKHGMLQSRDPRQRSVELQWLMVQMSLMGPMAGQAVHFTRYAPAGNDYSKSRYYSQSARVHRMLEKRLGETPFFGGDTYSIADIAFFPWVSHMIGFFPWVADQGLASLHPNIARWYETVQARPAVARGVNAMKPMIAAYVDAHDAATPSAMDHYVARGAYSETPSGIGGGSVYPTDGR